jgi:hypothetical protein
VGCSDLARIEAEIHCRDGASKWVWLNMRAARDESGNAVHFEGTVEDITDRREATEHLRFLAYYDPLTGCPTPPFFRLNSPTPLKRRVQPTKPFLCLSSSLPDSKS